MCGRLLLPQSEETFVMTHRHTTHDRGDFGTVPYLREDKVNQYLRPGPSAPEPVQPLRGTDLGDADVCRKRSRLARLRPWFLAACAPLVLAALSWVLGGNAVWGWSTLIAALLLIVLAATALRVANDLKCRHFLVFGYLIACWGSWALVGFCFPKTQVRVESLRDTEKDEGPTSPIRVSYGGEVRVVLDRFQECSFPLRGPFFPAQLRIETFGPDGWVPCSFESHGAGSVRLQSLPLTRLYIDNRGHDAVTLTCGQWNAAISAGSQECLRIPRPCVSRPLLIDGRRVGDLDGENFLVDTLGTRAYQFQTAFYEGNLWTPFTPTPQVFHGGQLHRLPNEIDYFLEPAPEQIKVTTLYGLPLDRLHRTELQELRP
jgi:hypothetical protein